MCAVDTRPPLVRKTSQILKITLEKSVKDSISNVTSLFDMVGFFFDIQVVFAMSLVLPDNTKCEDIHFGYHKGYFFLKISDQQLAEFDRPSLPTGLVCRRCFSDGSLKGIH